MGDILSDYTVIRELLGVTAEQLPDATVEADELLGYAEVRVKAACTTWAAETGANLVRLKTAVSALVAAQLVVSTAAGEVSSVQLADWRYELTTGGIQASTVRRDDLLKLAREALAGVTTITHATPVHFTLAGPTRKAAEG